MSLGEVELSSGHHLVNLTRNMYEEHQMYLHQQDVLGTCYDTLSIFQSLPLFRKLEKIRILDFDATFTPEDPRGIEYTKNHIDAVVRAFHNIVKVLAFAKYPSFQNIKIFEIDRFEYQAFAINDRTRSQFEEVISRILVFQINNLTTKFQAHSRRHQGYPPRLGESLLFNGDTLEELILCDKCVEIANLEVGFPWSWPPTMETRQKISLRPSALFPNLRKLHLEGQRTVDMVTLSMMFMSLPPGILKELTLKSLGVSTGTWADFFVFVGLKTNWVDSSKRWAGAKRHATVQAFIKNGEPDFLVKSGILTHYSAGDNTEDEQQDGVSVLKFLKKTLWRGVKIEKCSLSRLFNMYHIGVRATPAVGQVSLTHLKNFEEWMIHGIEDESTYEQLFMYIT